MLARKNSVLDPLHTPSLLATGLPVFTAQSAVFLSSGSEDLPEAREAPESPPAPVYDPMHAVMLGSRPRTRAATPSSSDDDVAAAGTSAAIRRVAVGGHPIRARRDAKRARDKARNKLARCARPEPHRPTKPPSPANPVSRDARHNPLPADYNQPSHKKLWRFFELWKRIDHKGTHATATVSGEDLAKEFHTLTGAGKYYWVHMYELWRLYERQQIALRSPLKSKHAARDRSRETMLGFYYLTLPQQNALVDDWISERDAGHRTRHAEELEACLAKKTLAKIKADMLTVVANIDFVLRENIAPHKWRAALPGI